jgi:hypothetical protein
MQKKSAVQEGSDGVGAGRGSWREAHDARAAEASTPKHWASIERRRKRQTARKDQDKGRSSKRARRALEARVADRNVGARVDAREQPDYGLRGRDDNDKCFAEHEYDTIWGDTLVASRREPCASPPVKKLDFEAVALHLCASSPLEPATPAPGSVLKASETPAPPPVVRQPAFGAQLEPASPPVVKQLDFEAIELEAPVANPPAVPQEQRLCHKSMKQFYDAHEWEVREHGHNSAWGRALSLVAVSKNFDAVYAASYAEQVEDARLLLACLNAWQSVMHIQACWRGASDRKWIKMLKMLEDDHDAHFVLRKHEMSRLKDEMPVAEFFIEHGISWDPVWVVVYLEGQALYKGKKFVACSVLGVADEQLFSYNHATLRDVFELMIEDRGMGAAATHVLRSVAGRELLDLDQTLHEANKQRCIERVREQRGLFLELCRRSDVVEPIESPSELPVAPSVPASVSARHRPCPARGSTLTPPHRPTPQRQCATRGHACAAVPRVLVSLRGTPAPVPA